MDVRDQLQLLPGTKKRLGIKVRGENRFLYIGSAILGVAIVSSFALGRYDDSLTDQLKQINDNIQAIEQERDTVVEASLILAGRQIDTTSQAIKEHVYLSKALSRFVSSLQTEIELISLSVSSNTNEISFLAHASSYTVVARQIATFLADQGIKDISLGAMSSTPSGQIEFNMKLTIDRTTFFIK